MNEQKNDIKMPKENKKKLIVTSISAVLLLIVLIVLNSIDFDNIDVSSLLDSAVGSETEKIYFSEPDFEENVLENEDYLDKNRYINYTEAPFTTILTEKFNDYGEMGEFWISYFEAVINGDSESYNALFTDAYFEDNDPKGVFTMQMVYDIEIVLIDKAEISSNDEYNGLTQYKYKVGYKIMRNNGTFRDDLPSDTVIPLIFELLPSGDSYKINSISRIKYKK